MKVNDEYGEILALLASLSVSEKLQMVSFLRSLKDNEENLRPLSSYPEAEK